MRCFLLLDTVVHVKINRSNDILIFMARVFEQLREMDCEKKRLLVILQWFKNKFSFTTIFKRFLFKVIRDFLFLSKMKKNSFEVINYRRQLLALKYGGEGNEK